MQDGGDVQYVVNELLTFVIHKLQYMPPDSVTQLCVGFYEGQIIERASKLLFEPSRMTVDQWLNRHRWLNQKAMSDLTTADADHAHDGQGQPPGDVPCTTRLCQGDECALLPPTPR